MTDFCLRTSEDEVMKVASSKEYLDFVLEQLSDLDGITFKPMMGEYILYMRGKIIGGIYDDRFLVKPVKSAITMMPDADMELPYEGAKEMLLVDNVDNRAFLKELLTAMYEELPAPKRKKVDPLATEKGKLRIETARLVIMEFTLEMAQDVCDNSLDEDNRQFVPDEVFETAEEAKEAIAFLMAQYGGTGGPLAYPVFTKRGGANIGYVQMVPIGDGRWEIGYHIAKQHTGNGYATEAVRAFLPVMAKRIGIDEVHGICLRENAASKHVLSKCGFVPVFEGIGDYQGEKREIFRSIWRARKD